MLLLENKCEREARIIAHARESIKETADFFIHNFLSKTQTHTWKTFLDVVLQHENCERTCNNIAPYIFTLFSF